MAATYKPTTEADIGIIVAMMREFYAIDNYPMDVVVSEKLFLEFLSNPQLGKSWLILSEDEIVGYVILTFIFSFEYGGRIAFLDELYVTKQARGKGIGKHAIKFIQEQARTVSLKLIYLEVEPHNEKARRLYVSGGFEMHKRTLMQYKIT